VFMSFDELLPAGREHGEARVAHAARLLLGTDRSVEAIGEQTGFTDGSHFHRAFLKHYGCTPTEFRLQGRQIRSRKRHKAAAA